MATWKSSLVQALFESILVHAMSNPAFTFSSVEDVFSAARTIADDLSRCGQTDAAREIIETVICCWITSSEALGEMRLTLLKLRPTVKEYAKLTTL